MIAAAKYAARVIRARALGAAALAAITAVGVATLLGVIAAVTYATTATAYADSKDDQFLASMSAQGEAGTVSQIGPAPLIAAAHHVCDERSMSRSSPAYDKRHPSQQFPGWRSPPKVGERPRDSKGTKIADFEEVHGLYDMKVAGQSHEPYATLTTTNAAGQIDEFASSILQWANR